MEAIAIRGGKPLFGRISAAGSKNAALPILFATILTRERLPDIGDVRCALDILRGLGAQITREGGATFIDTESLIYRAPQALQVSRIRASTYLIGACLSRFGECPLMPFGGCNFSDRPIDMHVCAAQTLGAVQEEGCLKARRLLGGEINFSKPSVGATVNAILLSACADGRTVIRGYAREPHIDSLIDFLLSAGAEIERYPGEIIVQGRELHGGHVTIPGDMIEAGTYLTLGVVTGGEIEVSDCPISHLSSLIDALSSLGAEISVRDGAISARAGDKMRYSEIVAEPYPGFPTDLQPIISVLMARFFGGIITDNVWRTRFGYFTELSRFGVSYRLLGNSAEVYSSELRAASADAPDLRGGMALIMAALSVSDKSVIGSVRTVERGYESLTEKLRSLGADVRIADF